MPTTSRGIYRIDCTQQTYIDAIIRYNAKIKITSIKAPDGKKTLKTSFSMQDLPEIIFFSMAQGLSGITLEYSTRNGESLHGLFSPYTASPNDQTTLSATTHMVCDFLAMQERQIKNTQPYDLLFPHPVFSQPLSYAEAREIINSMNATAVLELRGMKHIFFEYNGIPAYICYGNKPAVDTLESMVFDIDDGFIYHGQSETTRDIQKELQKFFTAWKENNYQGPIIDSTQLNASEAPLIPENDALSLAPIEEKMQEALGYVFFDTISSDQKYRMSGMRNVITVSDNASGDILCRLEGHASNIACVAMSSDGRTIASAGTDNILKIWDIDTQTCTHTMKTCSKSITHVGFTPNDQWILTGYDIGWCFNGGAQLEIWDRQTGTRLHGIQERVYRHGSGSSTVKIQYIALSSDGKELIVGFEKNVNEIAQDKIMIKLWPNEMGISLTCSDIAGNQPHVHFTKGNYLLLQHRHTLSLWHKDAEYCMRMLSEPDNITDVIIHHSGKLVASTCSNEGIVKITTIESGKAITIQHKERVRAVAFSTNDNLIATYAGTTTLRVWDYDTRQFLYKFKTDYDADRNHIGFSHDNRFVYYISTRNIHIYDTATGAPLYQKKLDNDFALPPEIHPSNASTSDETTQERDDIVVLSPSAIIPSFTRRRGQSISIRCFSVSPDSRSIVFGLSDHSVRQLDCQTHEWHVVSREKTSQQKILHTPDGARMITVGSDGLLKIWDCTTKNTKNNLFSMQPEEKSDGLNLALSDDNRWFVTAGRSGCIEFWSLTDGTCLERKKISHGIETLFIASNQIYCQLDNQTTCTVKPSFLGNLLSPERSDSYRIFATYNPGLFARQGVAREVVSNAIADALEVGLSI